MPFHHGIVNPIIDIIGQIPRGYSPTSNSPGPIGSTTIGDQMESIAWGAMTGLPGVGIPMAGIAYAYGAQADPLASATTSVAIAGALYYFAPRTSAALWQVLGYSVLRSLGFRMAGNTAWAMVSKSPYKGGAYAPAWLQLLVAYGAWKSAEFIHWYFIDPKTTDLDRDKKMREHNAPR